MNSDMLKPILAGVVRHALTALGGMLVTDGVIQSSDVNGFVGAGLIGAGVAWSWWQKVGQAQIAGLLKKLTAKPTVPTAVAAAQVAPAGAATPAVSKVVAFFAVLALGALIGLPAHAQHKPKLTGDIGNDIANAVGASPTSGVAQACDFNLFANLSPTKVVGEVQNCVKDVVQDGISRFQADTQAALASATTSKDSVGTSCLTPALAIVVAAAGAPAVPANGTTPAVAAVLPGPVLIFQKYREFVLAGGPTACKSWVNTTIAGSVP